MKKESEAVKHARFDDYLDGQLTATMGYLTRDLPPLSDKQYEALRSHVAFIQNDARRSTAVYERDGLWTANDLAAHLEVTPARARAIIVWHNRVNNYGRKLDGTWILFANEAESICTVLKLQHRTTARKTAGAK